jgi:phosphatidate cytidylyltransferase
MISNRGDAGKAFVKTGLFFGLILNIVMYFYAFGKPFGFSRYFGDFDARVILAFFVIFVAVILVLQLFTRPLQGGIYSLAVTVFGVMYLVLSMSHIILLKSMKDGIYYIVILIAVVMLNDTGAYFGGVLFGKHKAGIEASPNKSWEGYFSGLLFSIIGFILANQVCVSFFSRELFTMLECTILGMILSVLANLGDLVESAAKRDGGFKDSGSIIPGHGGMWDVFDATMFSLPFFYYYLVLKGIP